MWRRNADNKLIVQVDGAVSSSSDPSGLGVVVRDQQGHVLEVWRRRDRPQTNNEAEYRAMIWALERLRQRRPSEVHIFSDSEVMVNQMRGRFAVHSTSLRSLHRQACELARSIPVVTYTHIPRELNSLADALAAEALWPQPPWERNPSC